VSLAGVFGLDEHGLDQCIVKVRASYEVMTRFSAWMDSMKASCECISSEHAAQLEQQAQAQAYKLQLPGYEIIVNGLALIGLLSTVYLVFGQCRKTQLQTHFHKAEQAEV
jgi:hypothetical protein